jgi:serine/threonine protein kinase
MLSGRPVTESTDVWSLGVILYALVAGELPFSAADPALLSSRIVFDEPSFSSPMTSDLVDLITRMLEKDSSKRISLKDIQSHRWTMGPRSTRTVSLPVIPSILRPVIRCLECSILPVPRGKPAPHRQSCHMKTASNLAERTQSASRTRMAFHRFVPVDA